MRLRQGTRVLDRGDGTLQVGVRAPVMLASLSPKQRLFVELLETAHVITPHERSRFAPVVRVLEDAGLLTPARPSIPPRTAALNDAGPVGVSVATALARSGWAIRLVDEGPAAASPRDTYASGGLASTRQAAAADTVSRLVPGTNIRVGAPRADVWVLVSHGAAALDLAVALMASDTPHLFVITDERGAQVGPLVIPGEGACGMCAGHERAATDPAWPVLSLQLRAPAVAPPQTSADVAASVSGLVCGALGAWRSGDARAWLNRTWVVTTEAPPVSRSMAADIDCGCGAAGPVGDELAARRARFQGA